MYSLPQSYNQTSKCKRCISSNAYIFHVVFTLLGQFIRSEVRSSRGRADAVVHTPTAIYVFEFKLDGTADAALKQIDEKGYLIPYTLDGRKLVKVGVNFSKETRNIDEYIVVEE